METFTIFYNTKKGLVTKKIKGNTLLKAFDKLHFKIKMCDGYIIDDNENQFTFSEINSIKIV